MTMGKYHEPKSFDELSEAYGHLFNLVAAHGGERREWLHDIVGYSWDYVINPHLFDPPSLLVTKESSE